MFTRRYYRNVVADTIRGFGNQFFGLRNGFREMDRTKQNVWLRQFSSFPCCEKLTNFHIEWLDRGNFIRLHFGELRAELWTSHL